MDDTRNTVNGEVVKEEEYTVGRFFSDLGQAAVTLVLLAGMLYLKKEFKV